MCGIFGFVGKVERHSHEIVKSMMSQQHRGHDAWGLCFFQNNKIDTYKQTGAIDIHSVRHFYTNLAIGHNRYQTSGRGSLNEIQPFATPKGILAHNGQIVNISDETFGSDTSAVFNFILKNGVSTKLFDEYKGAYSFIGKDEQGLYAIRDPNGFRPLFMGRSEDHFVAFASEEQALSRFGAHSIEEVQPGSIVRVSNDLDIQIETVPLPERTSCFFESMYFSSVESSISGARVIETREILGKALALQVKKSQVDIDLVVPVPDTSIPSAILMAEHLGKPYREYILKNPRSLRTFITRDNRKKSIEDKYFFMNERLKGKNILLVDDSIVRGSTILNINRYLRNAGVKSIHVASTCPPIKYPCAFGIDFPSKEELVANQGDIQKQLGADSLHYFSMENLKEIYGKNYCFACVDGNYPIAVSKEFFEARISEHI